ncbi:YitT family protein [Peribacillus simplex]|uniref:YitT family protein n=1 Tax=Peribacillus simplex TaxID=1478 RepID=UPI00296ECE5D|nr:YitT family protein [Peribacillus simplex]
MIFIFQKAAAILIGSLLLSIGINGFLIPHQLLDGGITKLLSSYIITLIFQQV